MPPDSTPPGLLSARETCEVLGISQATLYAYVSRGLLESRPGPDHRSRLYSRHDVERLAQRKLAGRGAARGAAQSLDRGLPVLETQISLIRPDSPYYRGRSAIAAVREGATLEDVARCCGIAARNDPFALPLGRLGQPTVAAVAGIADLRRWKDDGGDSPLALEVRHPSISAPRFATRSPPPCAPPTRALLVASAPSSGRSHCLPNAETGRRGVFATGVAPRLVVCADQRTECFVRSRACGSTTPGAHLNGTYAAAWRR